MSVWVTGIHSKRWGPDGDFSAPGGEGCPAKESVRADGTGLRAAHSAAQAAGRAPRRSECPTPRVGGWVVDCVGDSDAREVLTELERWGQSPPSPPQLSASCHSGAVKPELTGWASLLLYLFVLISLCDRRGSSGEGSGTSKPGVS